MSSTKFRELAVGTAFTTLRGGRPGQVVRLLGSGGQGAVYEAMLEQAPLALKWYHESYIEVDRSLRQRLTRAIERGAPDPSFLWPLDLVEIPGEPGFGYVMALREPQFHGMRDLIARPPRRIELSLEHRVILCTRIAQSFLELHARGFCYQDINFGNFFLDPATVEVRICDNDNVNVDGAEATVYGTRKFMAPEVVRLEGLPNTRTDLFSMAVLFFYALIGWHPLDGKREAELKVLDARWERALYGTRPIFLFDPDDDSNGPVEGMHDTLVKRWNSLPERLRQLFVRSFSAGLHDPDARVLEREWRNAFTTAQCGIFACGACGYEHAAELVERQPSAPTHCLSCGAALAVPPLIAIGRHLFAASTGRSLLAHLLEGGKPDYGRAAGTIEPHPSDPTIIGLRNRTTADWRAMPPGRPATTVPAGKAVRIVPDMAIAFGGKTGRVVRLADTSA